MGLFHSGIETIGSVVTFEINPTCHPLSQLARTRVILHGPMDVAQGVYCIAYPQEHIARTGDMFADASDKVMQSVGKLPFAFSFH